MTIELDPLQLHWAVYCNSKKGSLAYGVTCGELLYDAFLLWEHTEFYVGFEERFPHEEEVGKTQNF